MCLLVSFVCRVVDEFTLERAEKALDHRVVVTVANAAHAGFEVVIGQQLPVLLAGVLDASVTVM